MRVKLSLPNECNDPFEFTPRTKVPTREDWLWSVDNEPGFCAGIREQAVADGKTPPPLGPEFQRFLREEVMSANTHSIAAKLIKPMLQSGDLNFYHAVSQQVAFLCLTDVNASIPMWAHYADNQRGVVIEFNTNDNAFRGGTLSKVTYRKTRVLLDRRKNNTEEAQRITKLKVAFSKSKEWSFESEYRMLFHQRNLSRAEFKKGCSGCFIDIQRSATAIESVILGCRISPSSERAIRRFLSGNRFAHVKLLRAERHPKSYSLMIVPA
jgi:hypothetical protein